MELTPPQADLLARLVTAAEAMPAVRAIWLSGSLASGEGDELSDVDLHLAVDSESAATGSDGWVRLARKAGAVFARPTSSPAGILVNAATGEGVRFDIVVHPESSLAQGVGGPVEILRDPHGILADAPTNHQTAAPRPEQVLAWIEEFLRSLLLLTVVGPRDEWISAEAGSLALMTLAIQLMLAENGEVRAGSALRLSRRLTGEQRAVLSALPPLLPKRESVTAFQVALTKDFLPRARRLCSQVGASYPVDFEQTVRRQLGHLLDEPAVSGDAPAVAKPATSSDSNPLIGEYLGPPAAPYYVYLLIDPRDGQVFYVGKGTGDRYRAHGVEALFVPEGATDAEAGEKIARIRDVRRAGLDVRVEFARFRIGTENEAYALEASLIDALGRHAAPLTNVARGHDSDFGLVSLEELEQKLAAPELVTDTPAILIKLGWWTPDDDQELPRRGYGFRPGMSPSDLHDSVRAWWVLSPARAATYAYAVAVYQGVTRGVWQIDHGSWRSWDSYVHGRSRLRWAFEGRDAPPEIVDSFFGTVGRRVPRARPGGGAVFGSGQPIAYWPR